jgi:hypothetical protein
MYDLGETPGGKRRPADLNDEIAKLKLKHRVQTALNWIMFTALAGLAIVAVDIDWERGWGYWITVGLYFAFILSPLLAEVVGALVKNSSFLRAHPADPYSITCREWRVVDENGNVKISALSRPDGTYALVWTSYDLKGMEIDMEKIKIPLRNGQGAVPAGGIPDRLYLHGGGLDLSSRGDSRVIIQAASGVATIIVNDPEHRAQIRVGYLDDGSPLFPTSQVFWRFHDGQSTI